MKRSPLKRSTPLARVSPKRKKLESDRRKFVREQLNARPICEAGRAICIADARHYCQRFASDVHEPLTRARGGSIVDVANSMTVCRACHDWIHRNPAKATELGMLVSARTAN